MEINVVSHILKQHFDKKKKDFPGLSSHWLAEKLSVSQAYVSQILTGKRALPGSLIDKFCDLLDIDNEKKDILTNEVLKGQGWAKVPAKKLREVALDVKAHTLDWSNIPLKDIPLLSEHKTLMILEATQLKDFDGTPGFLANRLSLSEEDVEEQLKYLQESGYLKEKNGNLCKAQPFFEMQSRMHKADIVRYHASAMDLAKKTMFEKQSEEDIESRLITSAVFTCSKENISLLKAKMAEFIKEISIEAADQKPTDVYQFGLMFFPLTTPEEK